MGCEFPDRRCAQNCAHGRALIRSSASRKWKSLIRKSLARAKDMMPLEQGVIERLMDLLR